MSEKFFSKLLKENEYELVGAYKSLEAETTFRHKKCKKTFLYSPLRYCKGKYHCPFCFPNHKKKTKKTTEEFAKEVLEKGKGEFELVSEYKTCGEHVEILHKKCNNIFKITPTNFLSGWGCSFCYKFKHKTVDSWKKEVELLGKGEYVCLEDYQKSKKKITFLHKKCNSQFKMRPNDFQQGHRCPNCAVLPQNSLPMKRIEEFLIKNGIKYEKEVTIEGMKHKKQLFFDFCILDPNDEDYIIAAIEYHGEQHFSRRGFRKQSSSTKFHEDFLEQKIRDKKKRDFTLKHSIPFFLFHFKDLKKISFERKLKKVQRLWLNSQYPQASGK
jgi:hypothetical protein